MARRLTLRKGVAGAPRCPRCERKGLAARPSVDALGREVPRVRVLVDYPEPVYVCRTCHGRVWPEPEAAPVPPPKRTRAVPAGSLLDGIHG